MPNIWLPEGILPGFKEACLEFYWVSPIHLPKSGFDRAHSAFIPCVQACYELEKSVLRALAIGFSLPEEYFFQFHKVADNQLRLLHYPPYVPAFRNRCI